MKSFGKANRHVFITLFFSVLIISLLPILFLSASFYYKSYNDAVTTVDSFLGSYLDEYIELAEETLYAATYSVHELSINKAIIDYEQFKDTVYYERLQGPFPRESLLQLYNYLKVKSTCLDELCNFKNRNSWYMFVEYYHESSGTVLTSNSFSYPLNERVSEALWYPWYRRVWDTESTYSLMLVEKNKIMGMNKDALLLAVRPVIKSRRTAIIVYIDYVALFSGITQQLTPFPAPGTLTVSSDDTVIYCYNNRTEEATAGSSLRNMTLLEREMPLTGWKITLSLSRTGYTSYLKGIRIIMYLSAALVVIVILFSSLLSARVSRPLGRLARMLGVRIDHLQPPVGRIRNEVQLLERGVVDLLDEKSALELQVNNSKPIYRENFIRGLLFGDTYEPKELESQFSFLDINLDTQDFLVIVVSSVPGDNNADLSKQQTETQKTRNVVRELVEDGVRGIDIELSRNRIAVVMNATKKTQKKAIDLAEELHEFLLTRAAVPVNVGIGYPYPDAPLIRRSFEEAQEALMYVSLQPSPEGNVLFIGDIRLIRTRPFVYPVEKEGILANMIMSGNTEGAVKAFSAIMDDIKSQRLVLHRYRIHHIILRLVNMISDRNNEIDPSYAVPIDEYSWVIKTMEDGGEDEVFQHILSLIETLTDKIRNSRTEKAYIIVNRICEMIENGFNTITLQQISDELSLSPSMMSKLFKEIKNIGFSDYLTEYRLQRGVELLKGSDMPISDIAHAIGYSNSNYFIRIFKHWKSITPGEYRRICRGTRS